MDFHKLEQWYQYLEDKQIISHCSDAMVWDKLQKAYLSLDEKPHLRFSDLIDLQDMMFRLIGALVEARGVKFGHELPDDATIRDWYKY